MTTCRQEAKELVRFAVCKERERAVFYRRLESRTDQEVDQEIFPRLAAIYAKPEDAAKALRTVLLGVGS